MLTHTACACGSCGCGGTQSSWGFFLEGDQGLILHLHTFLPLESEDPVVPRLPDGPRLAGARGSLDSCPWLPHPSNGDNKRPDFLAKRMKVACGCSGRAGLHRSRYSPLLGSDTALVWALFAASKFGFFSYVVNFWRSQTVPHHTQPRLGTPYGGQ